MRPIPYHIRLKVRADVHREMEGTRMYVPDGQSGNKSVWLLAASVREGANQLEIERAG